MSDAQNTHFVPGPLYLNNIHLSENKIVDGKMYIPKSQQEMKTDGLHFVYYSDRKYYRGGSNDLSGPHCTTRNNPYLDTLKDLARILGIPAYSKMKKAEISSLVWDRIVFE
jgi:hypothetical protein